MASSSSTAAIVKAPPGELPVTTIRSTSGWLPPRLGELWHERQLLYFLAWRDVKVRYAQTVLGAVWTIFQPLALMLVFTLAFRRIGKVETEGVNYAVFCLAGLTFWMFFSRAVTQGSDSLVANAQLVTKTSCPRLLIPLASITGALVDFAVGLAFFFVFAAIYGYWPSWRIIFLVPSLVLGLTFLVGIVLLLAPLNVRYRDVRQALPFLVQIWLFLSPVAYPITSLGPRWSAIVALNPLVGVIESFRWSLLGTPPPTAVQLASAIVIGLLAFGVGLTTFARAERTIADLA
ncbi:MAG TPA: ABC transporter permease [Gaiellaceae bacterium]|nr:ABC transporter permease [Gaiellaceae bacterium]